MSNDIRHFAINADDVERARRFYEKVFGWRTEPYGPPKFYRIFTGSGSEEPSRSAGGAADPAAHLGLGSLCQGALQGRRELLKGQKMIGFECTIGVEDVDKIAKAVVANGGRIVMEKTTLLGIGDLIFFEDTEGNVAGAMRYDEKAE